MVETVGDGGRPAAAVRVRGPGWSAAARHLRDDPVLRKVVEQIGPCTLKPVKREPYEALVRAIAHQQVHGRAAEAILGRFLALFPGHAFPPPELVLAAAPETVRACGFSGAKLAAIRDIAEKAVGGLVPTRRASHRLSDEALIERLCAIRGVGRWTVEMLLIFTLGARTCCPWTTSACARAGAWPPGWTRSRSRRSWRGSARPGTPWRSVAAWYLWRAADAAKRSAFKPQ
jgi:DNA-3-methyladenine glycosylase II